MATSTQTMLILAAAVVLSLLAVYGWYRLYRRPRDLQAPHRLGREMGLQQLSEGGGKALVWYGGQIQDHDFAATYVNLRYGSYARRRPALTIEEVKLSLRLALALNVEQPQDIIAYFHHGRRHEDGRLPPDFENAFDRRHTDRLSQEARDALLAFAQRTGSLRLRDRASAPAGLFEENVLPEAQVVLVHERPGYQQSPEEINALLEALLEVARVLEADLQEKEP